MGWLIIAGLFLITAFTTYGIFANIEDARMSAEVQQPSAIPMEGGRLSQKLRAELEALSQSDVSTEEWLQETRVPYGQCLAKDECDKTTRCVQCEFFGTSENDVSALTTLRLQELQLAQMAEERGAKREQEIHLGIANSIESHIKQFKVG